MDALPATTEPAAPGLDTIGPLTDLSGVGPVRAERLARLGLATIRDVLLLRPRELVVLGPEVPVGEARERVGERLGVRGTVRAVRLTRLRGRRSLVRVGIEDASGSLDALFFNQPWMRERFTVGEERVLHGRVVDAGGPALASPRVADPAVEELVAGGCEPRYPTTAGIGQRFLAQLCTRALEHGERLVETLPAQALDRLGLPSLPDAVRAVHAPTDARAFDAGRRRLAFEDLLALQADLQERRDRRSQASARRFPVDSATHERLVGRYPFELTAGQRRVVADLRHDLARGIPMRRLLQGDVGSGKTAVACYAAMAVAAGGGQTAFMAPTELLAEQHFDGLWRWLAAAGIEAELLTGSLAAPERRRVLGRLARGDVGLVFGTHALLSESVRFRRLDLAIVDEQHRFGVAQRSALAEKGTSVHTLLLTATPIPRTLALTLYGDLDVSLLEGAPPGRGDVTTRWLRGNERRLLRTELQARLGRGERAFWVCPRIGDDDDGAPGAERRHRSLVATELAAFGVELVHGRLHARVRAERLERFRRGSVGLLVATTLVEVGVDVPEATVMIVEHAERLGLAQLHQLRGRIGRGPVDGACYLLGAAAAAERFRALEGTRDGFELAERDLAQRGMGDLVGLRQSGANAEGLDDPEVDLELLIAARDLVREHAPLRAAHARRGAGMP